MNIITGLSVDTVSRIPALVCSPQSEYGCHKARSQGWPWSPNYINSIMCHLFCQFYRKVVLRLS